MTPDEAARKLQQMGPEIRRALRQAEQQNLRDGKKIAMQFSSGTFSSQQLRAMGHPYAKRHPNPPQDPAIINRQTGQFRASWRWKLGSWSGGKIDSLIYNTAPYGWMLERGTPHMIARHVLREVLTRLEPIRNKRLSAALTEALRSKTR